MDQDLVVRVQQGDQRAFEALTVADYPRLFRLANGILGDPHLAEDATQQAFLDI
jgi:DNA-directed RNA polymerase specialized sigma24 family protein